MKKQKKNKDKEKDLKETPRIYGGGVFVDDRGALGFNNLLNLNGVKRFYTIENHVPGFIRAWHGHKIESKYFLVVKGSAIIAAKKLIFEDNNSYRFDTDTPVVVETISDKLPTVFYIPGGYANGFKLLTADTKIMVFSTTTVEESKHDDYRITYHPSVLNPFEVEIR